MPKHPGERLLASEISRIRVLLDDSEIPMIAIAQRMGVATSTISQINRRFQIRNFTPQAETLVPVLSTLLQSETDVTPPGA